MMTYPKLATTVIGAYSVPNWFEALDRLVAVGQLSMAAMNDAQFRASQAAILDQELAGKLGPVAHHPQGQLLVIGGRGWVAQRGRRVAAMICS